MSADFSKTVRLGIESDAYSKSGFSVFCRIEYAGGKLSISGVEGPLRNGNAIGACGQIDMSRDTIERSITAYAPGWDAERVHAFFDVWGKWHLNDMRPYTDEMQAVGWDELSRKEIYKHEFTLSREMWELKRAVEADALAALRKGETFIPTPDEARIASMPLSVTVYDYSDVIAPPDGYEYGLDVYSKSGARKKAEKKTLGWVRPDEHPDGLLGKKLNGKGYGCAWYPQEVPDEVVAFLRGLPDTDIVPAWV